MKLKITVSGRVQGVGFRYTTKLVADRLGVKGYVKNLDNGSVYIEAIAAPEIMDNFLKQIKASPSPSGRVTHMEVVEDNAIKETKDFGVRY